MAVDANVVRRVSEYQIRFCMAEKAIVGGQSAGIAAKKAVGAENPEVTEFANWWGIAARR